MEIQLHSASGTDRKPQMSRNERIERRHLSAIANGEIELEAIHHAIGKLSDATMKRRLRNISRDIVANNTRIEEMLRETRNMIEWDHRVISPLCEWVIEQSGIFASQPMTREASVAVIKWSRFAERVRDAIYKKMATAPFEKKFEKQMRGLFKRGDVTPTRRPLDLVVASSYYPESERRSNVSNGIWAWSMEQLRAGLIRIRARVCAEKLAGILFQCRYDVELCLAIMHGDLERMNAQLSASSGAPGFRMLKQKLNYMKNAGIYNFDAALAAATKERALLLDKTSIPTSKSSTPFSGKHRRF